MTNTKTNKNKKNKYIFKIFQNSTELSKAVWELKQSGLSQEIRWKIVQHATPYQCGSKTCNLCLSEKLQIFQADPNKLLNKRSELSQNVDIEVNLNYVVLITLGVNKYINKSLRGTKGRSLTILTALPMWVINFIQLGFRFEASKT